MKPMTVKTLTLEEKMRLRDSDALDILDLLCQDLELTPTQFSDAESKYGSVGKWLGDSLSLLYTYSPLIIPQGSMRHGTTVKPWGELEFDIDLVCIFQLIPSMDPREIKRLIWDRLGEHEYYRKIREDKNRCVRLNYAGQFHMDVMPCIPDRSKGGEAVLVPDKELQKLKASNPKGFALWFDEICTIEVLYTSGLKTFLANREQARTEIEPLPDHDTFYKEALRRGVQLVKSHRDHFFVDSEKNAPISIILTTLMGHSYRSAARSALYDSPLDLLETVVGKLDDYILKTRRIDGSYDYRINNPTNADENFAERWCENNSLYWHFREWQDAALEFIRGVRERYSGGLDRFGTFLEDNVGKSLANTAIRSFSAKRREATKARASFVHTPSGLITTGAILDRSLRMPNHTNFGKH